MQALAGPGLQETLHVQTLQINGLQESWSTGPLTLLQKQRHAPQDSTCRLDAAAAAAAAVAAHMHSASYTTHRVLYITIWLYMLLPLLLARPCRRCHAVAPAATGSCALGTASAAVAHGYP
jgi:hypothetical protein